MTVVDLFPSREVPLGGLRDMHVQRALPQRGLPTVGAWCFLDRFGPQRVTMRVEPHPHTGLQTVTWPLRGEVRHRDSLGSDVVLKPGQLNLMTSGAGIAHSEYSLGDGDTELDAIQFWIALPEGVRDGDRGFERHTELPHVTVRAVDGDSADAVVVMGTFADATSPATTHTPMVGAQVTLAPGSRVRLPLTTEWEHALMLIDGDARVVGAPDTDLPRNDLAYLGYGIGEVEVVTSSGALLFLLGGEPMDEELVMWWNFVGRSHDDIVAAWEQWNGASDRFGHVVGHGDVRIPAPPLPGLTLTPRGSSARRRGLAN